MKKIDNNSCQCPKCKKISALTGNDLIDEALLKCKYCVDCTIKMIKENEEISEV